MPSPGRTNMLRSMRLSSCELASRGFHDRCFALRNLALFDQCNDFFVHQALFAMVRYRSETMIQAVELFLIQFEPQLLRPLVKRMASAMLAQHQSAFGHAYRSRVDNFVSGLLFQVTILMDAGLMRECVAAYDRLIGLWAKSNNRTK